MLSHTSKYSALTDAQLRAVGFFLLEWSNVDVLLKMVLSRLLLTPDMLGRTFTDGVPSSAIDKKIRDAIDLHRYRYRSLIGESALKKVLVLCDRASKVRSLRNKFAHFCWTRSHDEEIVGMNFSGAVPPSKKHDKGMAIIKLPDLIKYGQEAHALVEDISTLLKDLPALEENKEWAALIRKSQAL